MALERFWSAIPATSLTSNGTSHGILTIADTAGLYTKQAVSLFSDTRQPIQLQVQEVLSPTELVLGPIGPKVGRQAFTNISAYLVSDNAKISAVQQPKNNIPEKDHYSAIYESDPVVADRTISVDQYGRTYNSNNPIPTQSVGSAADRDWNDLILVRDVTTQDLVTATYKKDGITVRTLSLIYDEFENLIEVVKS